MGKIKSKRFEGKSAQVREHKREGEESEGWKTSRRSECRTQDAAFALPSHSCFGENRQELGGGTTCNCVQKREGEKGGRLESDQGLCRKAPNENCDTHGLSLQLSVRIRRP